MILAAREQALGYTRRVGNFVPGMPLMHPSRCRAHRRSLPRLLIALALLLCAAMAQAYERDFYFQKLDSGSGLAQNSVDVIAQDSRGYIWLATEGGLHRFD